MHSTLLTKRTGSNSTVVISRAAEIDYTRDYASLPREYGTPAYDSRPDVQAIRAVVRENLQKLDEEIHFGEKIRGRKVLLKPNLVTVFHELGTRQADSPETTDPRVIDAVIEFLQAFTADICIVESSGRGMPTWGAFRVSGLDRLAKQRGIGLLALEEQPVDRYLLPQARVMREVVIPRIFSQVVSGQAFYISMPKMKTNLYTGITLGFKNAMGILPYNLRQRNHNHAIDQKLVDLLYLVRPDLVIIDGIVGGEGNAPAPVDPVQSRVLISGNQAVETDRVAARMMGINPDEIQLIRIADRDGFSAPEVHILGDETTIPFKPADPSLHGSWMEEHFPNVLVLIGHHKNGAPVPSNDGKFSNEQLCTLAGICRGGCLATTRYAFDMLSSEGQRQDFSLTVIIGGGVFFGGKVHYFDSSGNAYSLDDINRLPGKKAAIGTCTAFLKGHVDRYVDGCMPFPNSPHMIIHQLSGTHCSVISRRNRFLLPALLATLRMCERRKALIRRGESIDIPLEHEDKLYPIRSLTPEEHQQAYIFEPFDPLLPAEIKRLCAVENRNVLATFFP